MFSKGDLVETKHYLKRGPMEIGALTLFQVQELSEHGEEYVLCAPMHSITRTKSIEEGIDYALVPIATEDLQYHFKGPKGKFLSEILENSRAVYSDGSEIRISLEKLIAVIDRNFNQ